MRKSNLLNIKYIIAYFATLFVVFLIYDALVLFYPGLAEDEALAMTMDAAVNLAWFAILTVILLWIGRSELIRKDWKAFTRKTLYHLGFIGIGFVMMYFANLALGVVYTLLGWETGTANQEVIERILESSWYNFGMIFTMSFIFAPIAEEIVFRKGLYGIINSRFNHGVAIIGNSVVFALMHATVELVESPFGATFFMALGPYMLLGLIISYIYYYSGRQIYVAIGLHMVWNLFSLMIPVLLY